MVQLGLALLMDDVAHNTVRQLQLMLARACGQNPALRLSPHVTLKQPFHARALEPVEAYFDQLAARTQVGELNLRGIGFFDAEENEGVAYLDVTPDPALEALRQQILRELGEQFRVVPRDIEDDRYHFHATLAYHLDPAQLACARQALDGVEIDLRYTLERLGLFYYTGDLWITYKLARLGSPQA